MIAFRQIRSDDFSSWAKLSSKLEAVVRSRPSADWKPAGACTGWVACSDDDIPMAAAFADRRDGKLLALFVHPDFRNKGIGNELLHQAEAWLFSHGWSSVSTSSSNIPADFLLSRGWSEDARTPGQLVKIHDGPTFSLEEHWIEDPETGYGRLVRLSRGPKDRIHPLCLVLDGETYWRDMAAVPVFEDLASSLPGGMTFAFVGHVSALARHQDFTGNLQYARFIGESVVPWLEREVSGLAHGGHLVLGLSLSGLMAVHLALRYPGCFRTCISQSGSHWWDHAEFGKTVEQHSPVTGRFWLSVGKSETATNRSHPPTGLFQEIPQVDGVKHAVDVLRRAGGETRYHEFDGGHSGECWRQELAEAIGWCVEP